MGLTSWTTRYRQIDRPTWRGRARHAAIATLAAGSRLTGSIESALKRPRVQFIYLHHVFEDEVDSFRALIRTLTSKMKPIDYSEGVERVLSNRIDRPFITFSFDDGFKNCTAAARILEEFGARGCFFVCPKVIGERDLPNLEQFARERLHLPPIEFMNWTDLEGILKRGHEIGNHTTSHYNLARDLKSPDSADSQMQEEIADAAELLRSRLGCSVRHFAWPYGHFGAITRKALDVVRAAGHRSIASGQRGAHVVGADSPEQLCIRRDHVIAAWPQSHVLYLLAKSARRATAADNEWPDQLR